MEGLCHIIAETMVVLGVVIIIAGVLKTSVLVIRLERRTMSHGDRSLELDRLRSHFGAYLLMGLEFSVAADIVATMLEPDVQGVLVLGMLVLIRTLIAYFLGREREEIRREIKELKIEENG